MEEQILRSIKRYIPDLVDMALKERPDADRGSVEVTAAVMLLIATIYMLNMAPRTARIEATIDAIVDDLPRSLEDRPVRLNHAILDPQVLASARDTLMGAYNTNLLGAFEAIYNSRISSDLARMGSMVNGPLGELGGVCVVTGEALVGSGKTPDMIKLIEIYSKHFANIVDAIKVSSNSAPGRSACFVATACFGSPHEKTVITLREFREVVLKRYSFGRALVKSYYRISPPLARKIERHPVLRYPVRITLASLARLLRRCFGLG